MLTMEEVIDLLEYLDTEKIGVPKGSKVNACCPIHRESNPSFGVNIDFVPEDSPGTHLQVANCFSCGFKGTLPWLVYKAKPDEFKTLKAARDFLHDRYGADFSLTSDDAAAVAYYDEWLNKGKKGRHTTSPEQLASFACGKETFEYFYERGFDDEDVEKFLVGRDLESNTVVVPMFWEDDVLAGFIGRYAVPRPKNARFKVYNFPKNSLIFPLNQLAADNGTLICVEAMFDAMMMHKWGFTNTFSTNGNAISRVQAAQIAERCERVIYLQDNDDGGDMGYTQAQRVLGKRVDILAPTWFPKKGKDPCDWGYKNTQRVLDSVSFEFLAGLKRMD